MSGPTPRRLWKYVVQRLRLATYFAAPGDGRPAPQIPARALLWGLVIGHILREDAFAGVDALVRGAARALGVGRRFSHDTLAYVTARLDPGPTRAALSAVARRAKRNKALVGSGWIGLAVDGTATTCLSKPGTDCPYCRPLRKEDGTLLGYRHEMAVLSIVNAGVTLPCDLELYGPGDSESAAGQRVLRRGVAALGPRFADYVVGDSKFATAPFLHTAGDVGLRVVARLKDNLPELHAAAQARFVGRMPTATFTDGRDQLEVWDASDFDPWVGLRWKTVRVLKYRQTKPNGKIIEAFWLTDWPVSLVSSHALYRMAKSRWEIENQIFNVAKTYHGLEHVCHHQGTSLVASWLITLLAIAIETLYRLRFLHRGSHPVLAAIDLCRRLRMQLACRPASTAPG